MERYYSFTTFCKNTFGHKLYKIPLQAGFTCPNRDGTCGTRGCIFCNEVGSGDFSYTYFGQPIHVEEIPYIYHGEEAHGCYIGYFQAFTNTYANKERLMFLYDSILQDPEIAGISIATRPDCIHQDVIDVFVELKKKYPNKFIWVELGLQTMHEKTAQWMRRGYSLDVFEKAVKSLQKIHVDIIVHVILGLYQEGKEEVLDTIDYLNSLKIQGVKLHLLHIIDGTDLAAFYQQTEFKVLSQEEYVDMICACIAHLNESIVIHRLTGDGDANTLIAPKWSLHKRGVLNEIGHELKVRNIIQGCAKR